MNKSAPFLVLVLLISMNGRAEETLRVRPRNQLPTLQPKRRALNPKFKSRHAAIELNSLAFSVTAITPLGEEVFPELRFKAFGPLFQLSVPVWEINRDLFLHVEGGAGVTLIKLYMTQPDISFTHYFFVFPLHLRGLYRIDTNLMLEAYLGFLLRPTEYDSRDTTDGGFHKVTSKVFNADIGIGLSFAFSPGFWGRFHAGYQNLGLGVSFLF